VKLLLSLLEPFLPENLLRCHPAQFADNIPDLIATHFQTDTLLHQAKINSEMFPAN